MTETVTGQYPILLKNGTVRLGNMQDLQSETGVNA